MTKYSAEEYLDFFEKYKPKYYKKGNVWYFFTLPTQRVTWDNSFQSGIDHLIDYIRDGNWNPDETSFGRSIRKMEEKCTMITFPNIKNFSKDDLDKYLKDQMKKSIIIQ